MSLRLITPPAETPVTLAEVAAHLRADLSAETALVGVYISAVTGKAESYLKRSIITQTLRLSLDRFPVGGLRLPAGPVQSITSAKYLDADGIQQTLDPAAYQLASDDTLHPAYGLSWPTGRRQPDAVKIEYVAGYGLAAAVPAEIKAWMLLNVANLYENRETVVIGNTVNELDTLANGLIDPLVNW